VAPQLGGLLGVGSLVPKQGGLDLVSYPVKVLGAQPKLLNKECAHVVERAGSVWRAARRSRGRSGQAPSDPLNGFRTPREMGSGDRKNAGLNL
jgi:hypothetical protein